MSIARFGQSTEGSRPPGGLLRAGVLPGSMPTWVWMLVGPVGVLVVGLGDLTTGRELSFSLFYAVPIAVTAWALGRRAAILISLAAAGVWMAADQLAGSRYSVAWIGYWNTAIRFGFFLIIGLLVARMRSMLALQAELAQIDGLTGVYNARTFLAVVEEEISRTRRYGHPLGLIYLDVDDFKGINDRGGHERGNEVLRVVAQTLRTATRATDKVGRMGGDEFAVLLPETSRTGAAVAADKLLEAIRADRLVVVSVGVATCDVAPASAEELIRTADEAMYAAKRLGKNRIEHRHVGPTPVAAV